MTNGQMIKVVEVGPRDGLQNEPVFVPTSVKLQLVDLLVDAGLRTIEATAFVSPKRIPQMADHNEVAKGLHPRAGVTYSALTPNAQGFQAALAANFEEVAVFASASETFSHRNIQCSVAESIDRFTPVLRAAQSAGVRVRGYVSCVMGCPFEGAVSPVAVTDLAARLYDLGCYEISLGDTIGTGTPGHTTELLNLVSRKVPPAHLAGHFHDTYGQALANVVVALQAGVRVLDASVSGLGGCPYAPGATGNLATEDLVYMLHGMGYETGIDLSKVIRTGVFISQHLGLPTRSHVARAVAGPTRAMF